MFSNWGNKAADPSDLFYWLYHLFLSRLLLENYYDFDLSIKYGEIMPWMIQKGIFFVKIHYETKSFEIQVKYRRKINFSIFLNKSYIFMLAKSFEAHGNCEDPWDDRFRAFEASDNNLNTVGMSLGLKSQSARFCHHLCYGFTKHRESLVPLDHIGSIRKIR